MSHLLLLVIGTAALLFIGVSAAMNALFLSSLGRTALEAGLLASVSIAADMTKAALPVVLARAIALRAWGEVGAATLMLVCVTALSLVSGTGFAALTREAASDARIANAERVVARRTELQRIEVRLSAIQTVRGADGLNLELSGAMRDRKWQTTNGCALPSSAALRNFCAEAIKLKLALAEAIERDRLDVERRTARAALDRLLLSGMGSDADPQASAIAALLGTDRAWPRVVIASSVTAILELGSVLLVLLLAGSALRGTRHSASAPSVPFVAAEVPPQPDRSFWLRQHGAALTARKEPKTGFDGKFAGR